MNDNQPVHAPKKPIFRKIAGIFLRIVLVFLLLIVLLVLSLQTAFVQNIIRGKAESYLSAKLRTRVEVGNLYVGFPHSVVLKKVYIEDRQKDTLLSGNLLQVDMDMWKLLHGEIVISEVQLEGITAKIKRLLPDTVFNFQFIVDAFSDSTKKEPEKKDTSSLNIVLHHLLLDSIRLVYNDAKTGNDIQGWIGHSDVKINELNLEAQRYSVPLILFKNSSFHVYQHIPLSGTKVVPAINTEPANPPQLLLSQIDLQNISLDYRDDVGAMAANVNLGLLKTRINIFNLTTHILELEKLSLNNTTAVITIEKKIKSTIVNIHAPTESNSSGWRITATTIALADNNIRYDDENKPKQQYGMDYAHIYASKISLTLDDLWFGKDSIAGKITRAQLKEQSGFQLDKFTADFLYANSNAYLKDFEIKTPGTILKQSAVITYPSLDAVNKDISKLSMDIDLANSRLQLKDIIIFAPQLRLQPAFRDPSLTLLLNTRITGNTKQLHIKQLQCSGFSGTKIDLSGTIRNVIDKKNIYADLIIKNISSNKNDITLLAPAGSLPQNISFPEQLSMNGKLKSGRKELNTNLNLISSSGTIAINAILENIDDLKNVSYNLQVQTNNIDLGAIFKDKQTYGMFTAEFSAKGKGLDSKTADAKATGIIHTLGYKNYDYRQLHLEASIANQSVIAKALINNPAIRFTLLANADMHSKFPAAKVNLQIDTIDLQALNLVKDTLQFKGNLNADFANTNPDSLQGNASLYDIVVNNGKKRFFTDSVFLNASQQNGISDIQLHADMVDMDWKGKYKPTETTRALEQTINKYYRFTKKTDTTIAAQNWTLTLKLRPSALVLALMPSVKGTDTIHAVANFNSATNDLNISVDAPHIQYGAYKINKTNLSVSTAKDQLNYNLQVGDAVSGSIHLNKTGVFGHITDNKLFTSVYINDEKNKPQYKLAAEINKIQDGVQLALNADSLLLNYEKWQVSKDNLIHYDSSGLIIHDFKIENNNQSLVINSATASPTAAIDIAFQNFSISSLTKFANEDSILADGILNGKAEIKNAMTNPVFTSDITIKDLSYKEDTLGDLALKINNEELNTFFADITLKGRQNDLTINGKYYTGQGRIDMKLGLQQLDLATLKPFTATLLQDISGLLKGNLAIAGTLTKPQLNGDLHFDHAQIIPLVSGEPLKLSDDLIEFDNDGFNFTKFTILDSANDKATIDGNVYTSDFRNYKFDLTLNANNFRLVNSPQSSSKLFYGKLNIDAAANITGDVGSPKVEGDIRVNQKTDFTLVLPSNDPEIISREGVVRFVDKNNPGDTLVINQNLTDSISRVADIKGLDITTNIETDSNALFTMVIDERSGDALSIRGRSDLSFGMDKSGKMSLTGNYEVESGTYNLSLDVLKRKFNIQRGSTITWTGDPTSAMLNLTATYAANTASIDLVEPELAGRPQTEINKFKQKLPFLVSLKMEGELLKPIITFDITLPVNLLTLWPDVDTKLQQVRADQSELNKQVFALLLLNRFVGENPLQSSSDALNAGQLAFQSASQILTNQLNAFAGSLIKGVDINFDLNNEQDYSTGEQQNRTDLNVTVSKKLFNDRISVNVGSNFELQGPSNPNENASNIAGDVAVDYRLSQDGRYMVRAYRKNQYELVVEGQVIETGISFILTLDYNKFKEIFGRSQKKMIEAKRKAKSYEAKSTQ